MNQLARRIRHLIEMHGPIDIARFMTLASSHPGHGYYPAHAGIGGDGDFLTAPEASQIFGELIGAWTAAVWTMAGRPAPLQLIELGPGRGTMLADLLRATRPVQGFQAAIELHLVETSPMLRTAQRASIDHPEICWHDDIERVPQGGYRIVVGNEFLDTLPIRQLQWINGSWHERLIGAGEDGAFGFIADPRPSSLAPALPTMPEQAREGMVVEVSPAREAFVDRLCHQLSACGGSALLIDYGDIDPSPGDSLQALHHHTKVEPLAMPGEADLTSRVTFAPLLEIARRHGVSAWGPVGQGAFLGQLGLGERLQRLCEKASAAQAGALHRGAERLASSDGMGELFKVIVLTTDAHLPPGFAENERWQGCC